MSSKEHLKKLEKVMQESKDLSLIMDYFLTHLGKNKKFFKQSKPIKEHLILDSFIKYYSKNALKEKKDIDYILLKTEKTDFIQVVFAATSRICNMISSLKKVALAC